MAEVSVLKHVLHTMKIATNANSVTISFMFNGVSSIFVKINSATILLIIIAESIDVTTIIILLHTYTDIVINKILKSNAKILHTIRCLILLVTLNNVLHNKFIFISKTHNGNKNTKYCIDS